MMRPDPEPENYEGIVLPDPWETGTCPTCGSFDVLCALGGRCTDAFHDIAVMEWMDSQFREPADDLPVYMKDDDR